MKKTKNIISISYINYYYLCLTSFLDRYIDLFTFGDYSVEIETTSGVNIYIVTQE